jgi:hypothetical protein
VVRDEEGPLFLSDGSSTNVLEADSSGLPQKFLLNLDTMALTFQRGVGIVEARLPSPDGVRIAKIKTVKLGETTSAIGVASRPALTANAPAANPPAASGPNATPAPPPGAPAANAPRANRTRSLADTVTNITEENPRLQVEAVPAEGGTQFVLTVTNTAGKLLPFHFTSSQSYDFVVTDVTTGQEVWRWSRRMFFSTVIRDEALRGKGDWKFDAVWNRRDNSLNPVTPGQYRVVAILTSQPQIEAEPIAFEIK